MPNDPRRAPSGDGHLYGPNTPTVDRFLKRLAALPVAELGQAMGRWRAIAMAPGSAWYAAEDAIAQAVHAAGRHDAQGRASEAVYRVFRRARWFSPRESFARVPGSEATAQYVSTSALYALVVRDALSPDAFAVVYGPFADVIPFASLTATE